MKMLNATLRETLKAAQLKIRTTELWCSKGKVLDGEVVLRIRTVQKTGGALNSPANKVSL